MFASQHAMAHFGGHTRALTYYIFVQQELLAQSSLVSFTESLVKGQAAETLGSGRRSALAVVSQMERRDQPEASDLLNQ